MNVFQFIFDFLGRVISVIQTHGRFSFAGFNVSYLDFVFGFLILSFFVTVFWKGARG